MTKGLVQIYTGEGKGKTTAALGLALRAMGHGFNVYIIQFMKGWANYGELEFLKKNAPQCKVESYGLKEWVPLDGKKDEHIEEARKGFRRAQQVIKEANYDLVILDELVTCIFFGLINENEVIELIKNKPEKVELVLTGHKASEHLINCADLVTEMVSVKHPFEKGIKARKGIEY